MHTNAKIHIIISVDYAMFKDVESMVDLSPTQ